MTNRIITFHILLAIQFLLVAAGIFLNIKVGLFSMVFTVLCTATCIVQLSNDNRTDWKIGQNTMTYMFVAWFAYYILASSYFY